MSDELISLFYGGADERSPTPATSPSGWWAWRSWRRAADLRRLHRGGLWHPLSERGGPGLGRPGGNPYSAPVSAGAPGGTGPDAGGGAGHRPQLLLGEHHRGHPARQAEVRGAAAGRAGRLNNLACETTGRPPKTLAPALPHTAGGPPDGRRQPGSPPTGRPLPAAAPGFQGSKTGASHRKGRLEWPRTWSPTAWPISHDASDSPRRSSPRAPSQRTWRRTSSMTT